MPSTARRPVVVVVGGGPAGSVASMVLAQRGISTVVLETSGGEQEKIGDCLPPTVNPLLRQLGLAEQLHKDGHRVSHGNRSVWGTDQPVENHFLFHVQGAGWHIDRSMFERMLSKKAVEQGVDWRYHTRLENFSVQDNRWQLKVNTPQKTETLQADFIVDATGRSSIVARKLAARRIRYDRLCGVAVNFQTTNGTSASQTQQEHSSDTFSLIEAAANGWWYSAFLPGGDLSVIYMTDSDLSQQGDVLQPDNWMTHLRQTTHTLQRAESISHSHLTKPKLFPAYSTRISRVYGANWLAVGDAATTFDPLSSHGIGSAMGSGFYAGQAIADHLRGNADALKTYAQLLDRMYADYLIEWRAQYEAEQRWNQNPFWRKRHGKE